MKNNESIFGHLVFALKAIFVLIIFKHFGWCEVVPDNFISISFIVVTIAMLVALVHDVLIRGILAIIDVYDGNHNRQLGNNPEAIQFVIDWLKGVQVYCSLRILFNLGQGYSGSNNNLDHSNYKLNEFVIA